MHLPQIVMAIWLAGAMLGFGYVAQRPRYLMLTPTDFQRIAIFGVVGALGEFLTLGAGGFWS